MIKSAPIPVVSLAAGMCMLAIAASAVSPPGRAAILKSVERLTGSFLALFIDGAQFGGVCF
jgi:hypothetical protein